MYLLHLEALPRRTTSGMLFRLLVEVGGLSKQDVGQIRIDRTSATVTLAEQVLHRVAKALDGATLGHRSIRCWAEGGQKQPGDEHFARLLELLEMEAVAERVEVDPQPGEKNHAPRARWALTRLIAREKDDGLPDRVTVALTSKQMGSRLASTRLGVGSPVGLIDEQDSQDTVCSGVVSAINDYQIDVVLSQSPQTDFQETTFRLERVTDEVARKRQRQALLRVRWASDGRLVALRDVCLGLTAPSFSDEPKGSVFNKNLNAAQQKAVDLAMAANDLFVIHGPPGTGKTTTVVELIRQAVRNGQRVLACAPSNMAVDNLLERLLAAGENAIRLGHPARVLPQLRDHTIDARVQRHPDLKLARQLSRDARSLFAQADRTTRAGIEWSQRRTLRQEARSMLDDARSTQDKVLQEVIDSAPILCATLTGLDPDLLGPRMFDIAVIDEAGQSTEPSSWIPIQRCQKVVLAGDHCQLPPTVLSPKAIDGGYGVSLMERLATPDREDCCHRLDVQYRMHEKIMGFSSREFYDNDLQAHESVRSIVLSSLDGVTGDDLTDKPVHYIDTAGADYVEQIGPDGLSRLNPKESTLACQKVRRFIELGVDVKQIAVICPYAAQASHIRSELNIPEVEVDTVDGFQGREKWVIVISLVRSNREGQIGFLADKRRMNVALTRARCKLIVIGDSATLSHDHFYKRLIDYFEQIDAYHSVWEEQY